jgi:glucosyl-dolichyl phosphate glucuronosyltransferase
MRLDIDVLVCGYNEAHSIPCLWDSLRVQTVGPKNFHVIFVDNASTDNTRQTVEQNSNGLDLEYVYEERIGKNWACNTGYQHATATYVAHIDADVKADSHWLEVIAAVLDAQHPDLLGGPHFPYYVTPKPIWYLDRYNSYSMGDTPRFLSRHEFLNGANMVWRRNVVEHLGGFTAGVGVTGRGLVRGDETELMVRAYNQVQNLRAFYHPGIIVYHLTRPETFSLRYWARRYFAQGCHNHYVWASNEVAHPLVSAGKAAFRLLILLAGFANAVSLRDRSRYPYAQNYVYERVLPQLYALGTHYEAIRLSLRSLKNNEANR